MWNWLAEAVGAFKSAWNKLTGSGKENEKPDVKQGEHSPPAYDDIFPEEDLPKWDEDPPVFSAKNEDKQHSPSIDTSPARKDDSYAMGKAITPDYSPTSDIPPIWVYFTDVPKLNNGNTPNKIDSGDSGDIYRDLNTPAPRLLTVTRTSLPTTGTPNIRANEQEGSLAAWKWVLVLSLVLCLISVAYICYTGFKYKRTSTRKEVPPSEPLTVRSMVGSASAVRERESDTESVKSILPQYEKKDPLGDAPAYNL